MKEKQDKMKLFKTSFQYNHLIVLMIVFGLSVLPASALGLQQESTQSDLDYKIGTGDLLEISVFELPELNQTVRVHGDGSISFSILGKVEVAGLSAQGLEAKLVSILDQKYTNASHVTVLIREHQKVSVIGAVGRPGMYELTGPMTLMQIISQAGGLTPTAMSELYISRQNEDGTSSRIEVNLEELIQKGNQAFDYLLQPKDVISIPADKALNVFVYGEVIQPGVIQYQRSKGITLLQAIAQAGGTTEWAKTRTVKIKRKDPQTGIGKNMNVNLKAVIDGRRPDIKLEEGDVVIVL